MGMMDRYVKYDLEHKLDQITLEQVKDTAKMRFFYNLGRCRDGRPLLYFRGSRFNAETV